MMLASGAARYAYPYIRPLLFGTGTVEWQTVTPPGAKCEVKLPGPMRPVQKPIPTPDGPTTGYLYGSEVSGQGLAGVMIVDSRFDNDVAIDDAVLLDEMVDRSVEGSKSTLVSKREFQVTGGYRGIEYEMIPPPGPERDVSIARAIWVRPRIYLMILVAKRDSQLWREKDVFLNSFELKR